MRYFIICLYSFRLFQIFIIFYYYKSLINIIFLDFNKQVTTFYEIELDKL